MVHAYCVMIYFTSLLFCSACSSVHYMELEQVYCTICPSPVSRIRYARPLSQAATAEIHHRRQAGERRRESSCAVCLCDFERRLFRSLEEPLLGRNLSLGIEELVLSHLPIAYWLASYQNAASFCWDSSSCRPVLSEVPKS